MASKEKENKMGKVISAVNQKGGVAKTTTAQALARELAKENRVLLIDFDGQATLTELMDLSGRYSEDFLTEYMKTNTVLKIFERDSVEPLDVTDMVLDDHGKSVVPIKELHFIPSPGNSMYSTAESVSGGRDLLLKQYMAKVKDQYDYIIIDSLPSVSTLFKNVLLASDALIIPIQCKTNAIAGANGFLQILDEVLGDYEKTYDHIFILPTMYNKQRKDDNDTLAEISTSYMKYLNAMKNIGKTPSLLLDPIPERSVFSNAQAVRYFLQDYIECFDTGKKDVLLLIEKMAAVISDTLRGK